MTTIKPFDPKISNTFADKAPRTASPHERGRTLNINVVTNDSVDQDTVDASTLTVKRVFRDAQQAFSAYKRLKQQNVERNRKNQLIAKKLNNEPPYNPKKLESMGQNWRSNRPTGFLSTMVSRIQPPFRQVIEQAPVLTYAKYPIQSVDADNKTKVFREAITRTIRGWNGFDDLLARVVHENTVYGYCALSWDDARDWKPEFLRQDFAFFSIETPQVSDETPIWARKRRYQIAELLPVLENVELSAAAGWHIKNLIKAINNAIPAGRSLDSDDDARRIEDWNREGSYGASYENDAKYVELGELVVREPHGKVSRFLFDDKTGEEICSQLDRYDRMSETLALFALEVGSGSLMSSRGAGRDLYNTHISIDKARNLVIDNAYIKGLLLLKKGPNAKPNIAPLTVSHPVSLISDGYEVIPQSLPADVDDFLRLDAFVSNLAEVQVGTFLPGSPVETKSRKTASEVNRVAAIENQLRQGILMRFSKQFSLAVERMQRGICHPEHIKAAADLKAKMDLVRMHQPQAMWARREVVAAFTRSRMELPPFMVPFEVPPHLDEDAISCCFEMLDANITPADIITMAFSPAAELLTDATMQDNLVLDAMVARYTGNPSINQEELVRLDWSRKLGDTVARAVILPKSDVEANQIEAVRAQILELQAIVAGQEVPVSPRDNDIAHLEAMVEKLMPVIEAAPQGGLTQDAVAPLIQAMKHFNQHIAAAEAKGTPVDVTGKYKKLAKKAIQHLTAGTGFELPDDITPAAAHHFGKAPGAKRPAPPMASAPEPGQSDVVQATAVPPRPETAA